MIQRTKRKTRGCKDRLLDKITDVAWSLTQENLQLKTDNFELASSSYGKPM